MTAVTGGKIFHQGIDPAHRRPKTTTMSRFLPVAAILLLAVEPTVSTDAGERPTVRGPARVIDGDELQIGALRIYLEGIRAPDAAAVCRRGAGRTYDCGRQATEWLVNAVFGRTVVCVPERVNFTDTMGRARATCFADGRNLNAGLVAAGWARAAGDNAGRYARMQAAAETAKRGLWADH